MGFLKCMWEIPVSAHSGFGSQDQQGGKMTPRFSRIDTQWQRIARNNGDLYLYSNSVLMVELLGIAIGPGYDLLVVNSSFDLDT